MPQTSALDLKRFHVLLALAHEPIHGYAIRRQIVSDSRQSLFISLTSLYRILAQLQANRQIECIDERYHLTDKGRQILRMEANDLRNAADLTAKRIR